MNNQNIAPSADEKAEQWLRTFHGVNGLCSSYPCVIDRIISILDVERARHAALVEDARYLADSAKHLTDHLSSDHPEWCCEDMDNVQHFAVKVRAALDGEKNE